MPKLHPFYGIPLVLVMVAVVKNVERITFLNMDLGAFDALGISAIKLAGTLFIMVILLMGFTYYMEQ